MNQIDKKDYIIYPDIEDTLIIKRGEDGFYTEQYEEMMGVEGGIPTYKKITNLFEDGNKDESLYIENWEKIKGKISSRELCMYKLLCFIRNKFEVYYDKHKPINLDITFEDLSEEEEGGKNG